MTIFGCVLRWSLFLHFVFFALDGCHRTINFFTGPSFTLLVQLEMKDFLKVNYWMRQSGPDVGNSEDVGTDNA
jgi:hypothetical protein